MPGPPPKKNARRRNYRPDWVTLPGTGRPGAPPDFPIAPAVDDDGVVHDHPDALPDLWADLWATPQADQGERLGWTRVVARYALLVLATETPRRRNGKTLEEVRHLEDRLGLTPMAMKRLQWEVGPAAVEDDEPADDSNVVSLASRMA